MLGKSIVWRVIMPSFVFNQDNMPSSEELLELLREAEENYDPVEELLRLERELIRYEQKYDMSSETFFQRYQAGEIGDAIEFVSWAGHYRFYRNLKHTISSSLDLVISVSPFIPF
jgi:hypothetical protein